MVDFIINAVENIGYVFFWFPSSSFARLEAPAWERVQVFAHWLTVSKLNVAFYSFKQTIHQ